MAETSEEAIRAYWKEHREQLRQCETQRSTLTNLLRVVTAALSGLIVQQKFTLNALPLCLFVATTGGYGAVAVAKYYERASYHLTQARALTATWRTGACWGPMKGSSEHARRTTASFPGCTAFGFTACG
ncbi:hypothetical protein ACIO7M_22855 [Streptomyces toxytricini]|uniref:SMODS and SLOG-associating 2TM effector domain-containing protein n=1 Tax=Streptomyces toxytricini TaxID=67369 RepID=A0ABW8EPP3_STRT5